MGSEEKIIVNFDEMSVYALNGRKMNNPIELHHIYDQSFKCWYDVWRAFKVQEHSDESPLFSDEFTRQDEILALFYKGECFALTLFKSVRADDITMSLDSYFSVWSELALKSLTTRGKNILVCSQFTVSPNYRQKNIDIAWKDILFSMSIKKFLEDKNSNAMTGTMRLKKGMGKMSYHGGGTPIMQNLNYFEDGSETVDLIAFFKEEVGDKYKQHPYYEKFESCWNRSFKRNTEQRILKAA